MKSLIKLGMSDKLLTTISKAIFTCQLAGNYLHEIRFTQYNHHKLKQSLNRVIKDLESAEKKEFLLVYDQAEDETCELSEGKNDLINEIASLHPMHYDTVTEIIKDYKVNYEKLLKDEKYKVNLELEK